MQINFLMFSPEALSCCSEWFILFWGILSSIVIGSLIIHIAILFLREFYQKQKVKTIS